MVTNVFKGFELPTIDIVFLNVFFHYEHGLSGTTRLSSKVQDPLDQKTSTASKVAPFNRRGGVYHPCRYINGNPFPKKHTFQWHCS